MAELLAAGGLPQGLAGAAITAFGNLASTRLQADPWLALELPGLRPDEVDRFALAVSTTRPPREDPRRGAAFVAHQLTRAARDGHTITEVDVVASAVAGLGFPEPAAAIEAALDDGRVLAATDGQLSLARLAIAEESVAEGCLRLLAGAGALASEADARAAAAGLDPAQQAGVVAAALEGLSVLTGGPGTGKSATVAAVVRLCQRLDTSIALAAPTGRAAKRLEELAGAPAATLHRLLGATGRSGNFARGEAWPLEADVVVVDEASMLDVELAAALVEACADGTHLMLVGDPAQLPSIGAGRVLADIIDSGAFTVTELTTLHRHSVGGAIDQLAAAIRQGELPKVDPPGPEPEVAVVSAGDSAAAARRVVSLVTEAIPRALRVAAEDIQVVTPVHRGPAGTVALNQALKQILNPGSEFDPGDRVVATANHLDLGFANGEVGTVTGREKDGTLQVSFGPMVVDVSGAVRGDLALGWAITVHRAQGSEWPAVVAVLPPEAGGLLSRPLVYTAFTRAQRHLSVVHACGGALASAVAMVGARPRRTRLSTLLRRSENPPTGAPVAAQ